MTFYTNIHGFGTKIFFCGYDSLGNRIVKQEKKIPKLYIKDSDSNCEFKSIDGYSLKEKSFQNWSEYKNFKNTYEEVSGFEFYGAERNVYEYIAENYTKETVDYNFEHIRIHYIDIETDSQNGFPQPSEANDEINAITLYDTKDKIYHVFAYNAYSGNGEYVPHRDDIIYKEYSSEMEMLREFLNYFRHNFPDILTGWNTRNFDTPYIINRINKIFGWDVVESLSPWNIVNKSLKKVKRYEKTEEKEVFEIVGINELDYLELYKKFNYVDRQSYSLDYISQYELDEKKIEYDGSLHNLYKTDFEKFIKYNIKDVELVKRLEEKLLFIQLICDISYMGKVPKFTDSLGTVKFWEIYIYNYLYSKNTLPSISKKFSNNSESYAGAYVKEPIPGKYEWIMSFDLASLYPSLIIQQNISPETYISPENLPDEIKKIIGNVNSEKIINKEIDLSILKKYDISMAVNGACYRKDIKGFFPEMMENCFEKRKAYKKLMLKYQQEYEKTSDKSFKDLAIQYHIRQLAVKILANSAYGSVGNSHFKYFSLKNAEAITLSGQTVIRWIERKINEYLNNILKTENKDYTTYGDTDSIFLSLNQLVKNILPNETDPQKITDFLDNVSQKKLEPFIKKSYEEFYQYMNHYTNRMMMKREKIASSSIFTSKKRYALNIIDNEGVRYKEPKIGVTGLEVIKSSTPNFCRIALNEAIKIMLNGCEEELQEFVANTKKMYYNSTIDEISFGSSVNHLGKYYDKSVGYKTGTPLNSKAGLLYNKILTDMKLTKRYETIKEGDKIRYVYIKLPNSLRSSVFGYKDFVPEEIQNQYDINEIIDYQKMFEKSFISPLEAISQVIGWNHEKVSTLF